MTIHEILSSAFPSVPLTRSKGATKRDVDWTKMSESTIAALAWHGLKQKANDPLGAKDLSQSEMVAAFNKVIDAHEANELRQTRTVDVFERELRTLAIELAKKRAKKENFKITADSYKSETFRAWVAEYSAKESVQTLAKARADELELLETEL